MIIRHYTDVDLQEINSDGVNEVSKRVLISKADGAPNFVMRQFTIQPGGNTPFHTHHWEHEVYVISGFGIVRHYDGETNITAGSVLLVLPNEEHGFVNTGDEPLVFLCSIPNL